MSCPASAGEKQIPTMISKKIRRIREVYANPGKRHPDRQAKSSYSSWVTRRVFLPCYLSPRLLVHSWAGWSTKASAPANRNNHPPALAHNLDTPPHFLNDSPHARYSQPATRRNLSPRRLRPANPPRLPLGNESRRRRLPSPLRLNLLPRARRAVARTPASLS